MPILTIRLPAELHERFLAECEKRDIKPSEFGRKAIEAIVDHMGELPSAPVITQSERLRELRTVVPDVRGFTMDGSPIPSDRGSRLKTR